MLCQNCNKKEANVKYTQVINGEKKQMMLCEECSKLLGIEDINFNIPIDFSNFFGDFMDEYNTDFIPMIAKPKELKCNNCNMSYEEFMNTGKFGCANCYNEFESKINLLLKRIHGTDEYKGRKIKEDKKIIKGNSNNKIQENSRVSDNLQTQKLQEDLKKAIKEERYEDAAKLRDEIKKQM